MSRHPLAGLDIVVHLIVQTALQLGTHAGQLLGVEFKLALEFFYDGSAMPVNQSKLWEVLDALGGSVVPDEPVIINEDYYYQRARELMLKRKEEIKFRLLELDDAPSKRKELRAEMRGIDYCVSILDKNY